MGDEDGNRDSHYLKTYYSSKFTHSNSEFYDSIQKYKIADYNSDFGLIEENGMQVQQTHVYEKTIYLPKDYNEFFEIIPFEYTLSNYKLGYARWYVWDSTYPNSQKNLVGNLSFETRKTYIENNGYRRIILGDFDTKTCTDGIIALDFQGQRDDKGAQYHSFYKWDGNISH